jgi:hypothetical protein
MGDCPFYKLKVRNIQSNEIRSDRTADVIQTKTPWCAHPHTPMPEEDTRFLGASQVLRCEGDISKCQVPVDKRADVRPHD